MSIRLLPVLPLLLAAATPALAADDGGKPLLARHRMVNATVKTQLDSGTIHALALKTLTPAEAG